MSWPRPGADEIREALRRYAPQLVDEPLEFLAEGWEFWAFTAGEYVLRFPKAERGFVWKLADQSSTDSLRIEGALTSELARHLSTPISVTQVYGEHGPNGAPFAGHRLLPGEVIMYATRPSEEAWAGRRVPDDNFGRDLGFLIRELHSFPAGRAVDLGVPRFDGAELRRDRIRHYEAVIRRVFPLISCEARAHIETVYEAYLNHPECFDFLPVLVHTDLAVNTLIDPATGRLSGLIDFADSAVTSPALDYWLPTYGLKHLGVEEQTAACLDAAGISAAHLERVWPEVEFLHLRYPVLGILHGLAQGDDAFVEESIQELNALLPRDMKC